MKHHRFIYDTYCDNPSLPVDGYVEELFVRFGLATSPTTIQRWFKTVGPFSGNMRATSRYPSARDSWATYEMLRDYLNFIVSIDDHSRLVFTNKKPMKEIDIYGTVWQDILTRQIPSQLINSVNSKNRYSILTAVNIKGSVIPPTYLVIIEKSTDSDIFYVYLTAN